ncbi:TRAP transporter small permease subunit [Tabrizicola sp.]|uniref:TRAP transporter small permease subunit n=1 Tax=Tabrizicola sp. TaxID=2005166 RepID=UPI00262E38C8|nr:TRAP transporter small permease subunit [Tabrizicola sp.]MDM7930831.1 TRAP transporter small permease subunit [Tabrizicola sp.]
MQALLALSRGIDRVNAFIGKSVIWLILLAVVVSAANAISRKLFNLSSNAWLELQWYLFGGAFMGAAAYTLQMNEHIRIDVFYASRTRKTQHWIDLLGHIFFLLPFAILMAWYLWPYTVMAFYSGQISTNAGGLIIWPARAVLLAGFLMLVFQALAEIIKKIAVMQGMMEDPHPFQSAQDHALQEVEELAAEVEASKAQTKAPEVKK